MRTRFGSRNRLSIGFFFIIAAMILGAACSGDTGASGTAGQAGAQGVTGPAGATGPAGSAGPAGSTGAAGPTGPAGAQGAAGAAGPAGVEARTAAGDYAAAAQIEGLTSARGVVFDWANTFDSVAQSRNWMISGELTLDCKTACTGAQPEEIAFDMAIAMFLDPKTGDPGAKGDNSHGHQFSNFVASATPTVEDGVLTILGTIDGSGPLGGPIIITLKRHAATDPQHFTFSFELPDHSDANIIMNPVSGVVVESMSN